MPDNIPGCTLRGYEVVKYDAFPIVVTEAAREKIALLAHKDGKARLLRVEVTSGGCSGKQYCFNMVEYDDLDCENDIILAADMPMVVVDRMSLEELKGATVDYSTSLQWTGFVVQDNPQSKMSCSCGSSFS
jgi:iron-sulfur cluster assembly accessory protein